MNKDWIYKCLEIKNGIIRKIPSEDISKNYLLQAENTLKNIENLINKEDFLWASVMMYYASYYSLYAFLQKLGIKSENHSCSIEILNYLFEDNEKFLEYVNKIKIFKKNRVDSQYYLVFQEKKDFENNFLILKEIFLEFNELCNLSFEDLEIYNLKLDKLFGEVK